MLKPKRTKIIKVGNLTFRKRLRKPTMEEKIDNKKTRQYHKLHKNELKQKAKIARQKIKRNPKLMRTLALKRLANKIIRTKKVSPAEAVRLAKLKLGKK